MRMMFQKSKPIPIREGSIGPYLTTLKAITKWGTYAQFLVC